jgi:hypothetical protein
MITGVHVAVSQDAMQAAFLRDKLGLPCYDAGGGFLIFEPPKAELAAEATGDQPYHLSFFCDDLEATIADLEGRGVACSKPIREEGWGRLTDISLPDGSTALLYQPKYSKGNPIGG